MPERRRQNQRVRLRNAEERLPIVANDEPPSASLPSEHPQQKPPPTTTSGAAFSRCYRPVNIYEPVCVSATHGATHT